ncbi:polymerase [Candidatus Oscillochloris fontis]|uniref:polymerase n=1 Tax=Candidatus Oscillochloris fontis TaxID=2496868 RepID=UPI00101CA813|nr:polymerase [Candidatus Oscillochloris fontis]
MNAPSALRRPFLHTAFLAGLLLILLAALALVVWLDNAANRGISFVTSAPPPPYSDHPRLGINLYNLQYEPDHAAVERSFALARELGAQYARIQMTWEDLEIHGRGDFEDRRNLETLGAVSAWAKYDRIVAAANAAEVELIVRLERPPAWARPQALASTEFQEGLLLDGNSTGPPDDYADFGHFVQAVVERYDADGIEDAPGGLHIRFFQIWNEPNLRGEWNWQEPSPEDFVRLLRIAAEAARSANPQVVILFPGLSPTDGLDWRAPLSELDYLDRIYQAGGADYFDILSAQSYGLGQSPTEHRYVFLRGRGNWSWSQPIDTRSDVSRVVLLREIMEHHGDTQTPVWVSEFGWNSAPDSLPPERRSTWGQPVTEEQKGAYLIGQIERARQEWPWMGVMNVWMLRFGGYAEPDLNDPTPYFALVRRDWQPLASYVMLQEYLARPSVAGVGAHSWDSPAVTQGGTGWQVRFSGARISLVGVDVATEVQIDGRAITLSPAQVGSVAALQSGWLEPGEHLLELSGAAPTWFGVDQVRPWGWAWDYGPLLLIIACAGVGALLVGGTPWRTRRNA